MPFIDSITRAINDIIQLICLLIVKRCGALRYFLFPPYPDCTAPAPCRAEHLTPDLPAT